VGLVPPGAHHPVHHGHTRQAELFGQLVKKIGGRRSLEFGCGTGYNVRLLSQWYPESLWHGVDLSEDHVTAARRLSNGTTNATFQVGDYLSLDLPAQSFDAILAVETLCQSESQAAALREAWRLLRPGGRMMVVDCFRAGPLHEVPEELARAARLVEKTAAVDEFAEISRWTDLARNAGFEVEEVVDRSHETAHDLTRLYRMARRFFKLPPFARSLSRRVAPRALQNVICGLLMPYTVGEGVHRYMSAILIKPI
jgi:ubiquinone/menaquinone biosynthesis C-methylase UbiE